MAYNREWDRGKDSWADQSWNDWSAGNVHEREEDYYGDGKRRKFNNGVIMVFQSCWKPSPRYIVTQGFRNSQAYEAGGFEDYTVSRAGQSGSNDWGEDRYHGGHNKKRMVPSEPSPHVIFLGLEPDFTEQDVRHVLFSVT